MDEIIENFCIHNCFCFISYVSIPSALSLSLKLANLSTKSLELTIEFQFIDQVNASGDVACYWPLV